jgi:hypothetical protein
LCGNKTLFLFKVPGMKALIVFTLFVVGSLHSFAISSGQLVGQVTDTHTGLPVPFAELVFENKMEKIVVTANEYGHYYSDHMPTGRYQLHIVYNTKKFVMAKIQVYDNYTSEIDIPVSSDALLPETVELEAKPNIMSSVSDTDIKLRNSNNHQPTQSLGDALSGHAGVDVRNGKLFIKGSDQVKFFVDGTPVLGQPSIGRIW